MKAREIRDLEETELAKTVAELRKEVFGLRFANATGELDDTASLVRTATWPRIETSNSGLIQCWRLPSSADWRYRRTVRCLCHRYSARMAKSA